MAPRRPTTSTKEKEEHQGPAPDPTATLTAALEIFNDDWAKDLNLYGKIAAISGHLGRIPKNGWNKFNSYAYVLESDLVEAIRWYLSAARILIFTESLREHNVLTFEGQAKEGRSRDILTDNVYVFREVQHLWAKTVLPDVSVGIWVLALADVEAVIFDQLPEAAESLTAAALLVGEFRPVDPSASGGPESV